MCYPQSGVRGSNVYIFVRKSHSIRVFLLFNDNGTLLLEMEEALCSKVFYNINQEVDSVPKIEMKQQVMSEIAQQFEESKSAVVVDYRGLNVAEVTALRQELRENNVDDKGKKNTITKRAVADVDISGVPDVEHGPTAIAFGKDDVVAPAKILNTFAKDHTALELKGGVIEGEVATIEQIKELSTLPDYDGLVSMLLSVLRAPIRNLAYATKAIADE